MDYDEIAQSFDDRNPDGLRLLQLATQILNKLYEKASYEDLQDKYFRDEIAETMLRSGIRKFVIETFTRIMCDADYTYRSRSVLALSLMQPLDDTTKEAIIAQVLNPAHRDLYTIVDQVLTRIQPPAAPLFAALNGNPNIHIVYGVITALMNLQPPGAVEALENLIRRGADSIVSEKGRGTTLEYRNRILERARTALNHIQEHAEE